MRKALFTLLALALLCAGSAFGQTGDFAPQQTAQSPLQLRISDGSLGGGVQGTFKFLATNILLTASTTNYVYLNLSVSPPVLVVNTTGFPTSQYYAIAIAVTNSSQITSLTDSRPALNLTPGGSSGGGGQGGPGSISASSFGVDGTANFVCDATFVSGTSNVTTPTTDPAFTAADVGKIDWGSTVSCGGNSNGIPTTLIAQGTILTLTTAHSIGVSTTASNNCTPVLADNCPFVWGKDHTSQLQAAWTALAATGLPGTLFLPCGGILIQAPPSATSNLVAPGSGSPVAGYTVRGCGQYSTMILTSPSMT